MLIFAKPSGLDWKQGAALGVALTPMSALAYLLVDDMYVLYPDYDPTLRAIVMCSIVVLQIVAPFVVYRSLSAVGERRECMNDAAVNEWKPITRSMKSID